MEEYEADVAAAIAAHAALPPVEDVSPLGPSAVGIALSRVRASDPTEQQSARARRRRDRARAEARRRLVPPS
jgi:hypothetical protein